MEVVLASGRLSGHLVTLCKRPRGPHLRPAVSNLSDSDCLHVQKVFNVS